MTQNLQRRIHNGFTLVETVLVIALLGVLAFALGPALGESFKSYDLIQSRRIVLMEARSAFERMVREIRLIESASDVLDVSSSTHFQFEYPNNTTILYTLNGTNLLRNGEILASPVNSISFNYYDSAGNITSTAANVRRINIQASFDAPGGKSGITLQSSIFLRNLGGDFSGFATQ